MFLIYYSCIPSGFFPLQSKQTRYFFHLVVAFLCDPRTLFNRNMNRLITAIFLSMALLILSFFFSLDSLFQVQFSFSIYYQTTIQICSTYVYNNSDFLVLSVDIFKISEFSYRFHTNNDRLKELLPWVFQTPCVPGENLVSNGCEMLTRSKECWLQHSIYIFSFPSLEQQTLERACDWASASNYEHSHCTFSVIPEGLSIDHMFCGAFAIRSLGPAVSLIQATVRSILALESSSSLRTGLGFHLHQSNGPFYSMCLCL